MDTTEAVIQRLLDEHAPDRQAQGNGMSSGRGDVRQFDGDAPPSLTHAKLLSAKVNDRWLAEGVSWNGLVLESVKLAKEGVSGTDELRRLVPVNFVLGRKEIDGYRFYPEIGMSIQGQDANSAWRAAAHIARQLGIPVEVEFFWRTKEGAAFPGLTGRLSV